MPVTISESKDTFEHASFNWDKITHSLNPETKTLPKKDREYFQSKISLLIGKEIRLSNIPPRHMYINIQRADFIYLLTWYPMLIPDEYINLQMGKFLSRLGLRISEDGLGWKYGPMGFQHQEQRLKQEILGQVPG